MNSGSRSPFNTNLTNLGPRLGFSWQVAPDFLFRGGSGIYYGPSPEMAGSASLDSDGFASYTAWNSTCYTADGNTVYNNDPACNGGVSTPDVFTGPYSLSNPFPGGVVPTFTKPPSGLANNLGISLGNGAPFPAHAHHLQLQPRMGVAGPAPGRAQRRLRRQPRPLPPLRRRRPQYHLP